MTDKERRINQLEKFEPQLTPQVILYTYEAGNESDRKRQKAIAIQEFQASHGSEVCEALAQFIAVAIHRTAEEEKGG